MSVEILTDAGEGCVELPEVCPDLAAESGFGWESLRRVGEEELVCFLDRVGPPGKRTSRSLAHACPAGLGDEACGAWPTAHRLGSWCSRYCRRVIHPTIIPLVIHHLSGRTAKYTWAITSPTRPTPASPCAT